MRKLLTLASLLIAAAPAEVLMIGGERFSQGDIVDARAVSDGEGPAVFITFTPAAAKRFSTLKAKLAGKRIPILFGDRPLTEPATLDGGTENNFQISGSKSFPEAEALALRISGKPPLPETFDE